MKYTKGIARFVASLFIFSLIPMNFLINNVQALESYKNYDKSSTKIENKYKINEKILKVQQNEDFTIALSESSLYLIKDGNCKKYDLGETKILSNTNILKCYKYVYLTPCKQGESYNKVILDIDKLKNNPKKIEDFMKSTSLNYNNTVTNLKTDNKENYYFKTKETNKDGKITYMIVKVSKDGKTDKVPIESDINDYEIEEDGSLWIADNEKISHISLNGKLIRAYREENIKTITKDNNGSIWVLKGDCIKEIHNDKIRKAYTVSGDSKEISVDSKENLAVKNTRGFTIMKHGKTEEVIIDSYVQNSALVLKDKDSDIRILSDNYSQYSDETLNDDVVLDVSLNDDKFNINNKAVTKFANYYNAIIYDGKVYFAQYNTLYTLKNNSMKEYVKFNKSEYNEFASDIKADKDGNMYVLGNKNIYVIDKNKNVSNIPLEKIYSFKSVDENLLKNDKNNDVYFITKSGENIKFNKLEGKNFRAVNFRAQDGKEPVNVFLNENNEFEFVYKDNKTEYKVYKLDENFLPEEDDRFNNEGISLMKTYRDINKLSRTDDGKLVLWIGKNMVYTKNRVDEKFIGLYDIPSTDKITSMVKGNDGRVYIGTINSGVICYGEKVDRDPAHYKEVIPKGNSEIKSNKEWTIKFNMKLEKDTVNNHNVIVATKDGERQDVDVKLDNDGKSIKVIPKKNYKEGRDYYIVVKKDVKSILGKNLNKSVYGKFTVIKDSKVSDAVKFEIIKPVNMDMNNKDFMETVINNWTKEFKNGAKSKNEVSKIGKVVVKEIKVNKDTAYIFFNAEIATENNGKIQKDNKDIGLNCKKVDKNWTIIK
ncbi:Ig-like domain-containing protein [Clostridium massiliodielmoense]|uniref:Ig-like domain-containing protein n=1 Tax=Clostridium massiliodielmoense TaxID=1776385 RepID=UPI000A26C46B|nr:Ig-like domain-containing protein [Clostridium massiliodielmoense]